MHRRKVCRLVAGGHLGFLMRSSVQTKQGYPSVLPNPRIPVIYNFLTRKQGWGKWNVRWRGVVHRGFWWGDLKEIYHLEDVCVDGMIILERAFNR